MYEILLFLDDTGHNSAIHPIRPKVGRLKSGTFDFAPQHLLYGIKYQKIRSKFPVNIITGIFPKYPKGGVIKTAVANKFAMAVLTILKPWDIVTHRPPGRLDWTGFCDFVKELSQPDAGYMQFSKLQVIKNLAFGLRPNSSSQKIMSSYRFRNVPTWDELRTMRPNDKIPSNVYINGDDNGFNADNDEISGLLRLRNLALALLQGSNRNILPSGARGERKLSAASYCANSLRKLEDIFSPEDEKLPFLTVQTKFRSNDPRRKEAKVQKESVHDNGGILEDYNFEERDFNQPKPKPSRDKSDEKHKEEMLVYLRNLEKQIRKRPTLTRHTLSIAQSNVQWTIPDEPPPSVLTTTTTRVTRLGSRKAATASAPQKCPLPPSLHPNRDHENFQKFYCGNNLNNLQVQFLDTMIQQVKDHIRHILHPTNYPKPKQLLIALLGGPGTGKSATIREFMAQATELMLDALLELSFIIVSSTTGSSAANMELNASTIHIVGHVYKSGKSKQYGNNNERGTDSTEDKSWLQRLNKTSLTKLRTLHGYDTNDPNLRSYGTKMIVTDEFSNIGPIFLANLSRRMQEVVGGNAEGLPFGGLDQCLVGDPFQLPPCMEVSLHKAAIEMNIEKTKYKPGSPMHAGAMLFRSFAFWELLEQTRAPDDPDHIARLQQLRNLDERYPVNDEIIASLKGQVLCRGDKDKFADSIVAITTNQEIFTCARARMVSHAMHNGCCVIAFRSKVREEQLQAIQIGSNVDSERISVDRFFHAEGRHDTQLWQYYCPGQQTMAFITKNVCVEENLANGIPCWLTSLTFDLEADKWVVEQLVKKAKPGEIIYLDDITPLYVNVSMHKSSLPAAVDIPPLSPSQSNFATLSDTRPVKVGQDAPSGTQGREESSSAFDNDIPDMVSMLDENQEKEGDIFASFPSIPMDDDDDDNEILVPLALYTRGYEKVKLDDDNEIDVHCFPYVPATLRTMHKLQGLTLPVIILELNERKQGLMLLTLCAFLVAFSRVTNSKNMKIMPLDSDNGLEYLKHLKRDEYLKLWYQGIQPDRTWTCPNDNDIQTALLEAKQSNKEAKKSATSNTASGRGRGRGRGTGRGLAATSGSSTAGRGRGGRSLPESGSGRGTAQRGGTNTGRGACSALYDAEYMMQYTRQLQSRGCGVQVIANAVMTQFGAISDDVLSYLTAGEGQSVDLQAYGVIKTELAQLCSFDEIPNGNTILRNFQRHRGKITVEAYKQEAKQKEFLCR